MLVLCCPSLLILLVSHFHPIITKRLNVIAPFHQLLFGIVYAWLNVMYTVLMIELYVHCKAMKCLCFLEKVSCENGFLLNDAAEQPKCVKLQTKREPYTTALFKCILEGMAPMSLRSQAEVDWLQEVRRNNPGMSLLRPLHKIAHSLCGQYTVKPVRQIIRFTCTWQLTLFALYSLQRGSVARRAGGASGRYEMDLPAIRRL